MKKYDSDGKCIKCGSGDIKDEHVPKHVMGFHLGTPPDHACIDEHIFRTCKNCGYCWEEAPLDIAADEHCHATDAACYTFQGAQAIHKRQRNDGRSEITLVINCDYATLCKIPDRSTLTITKEEA